MKQGQELNSPAGQELLPDTPNNEKVRMKKELGLLEGIAIIIGIICGSGMIKFKV